MDTAVWLQEHAHNHIKYALNMQLPVSQQTNNQTPQHSKDLGQKALLFVKQKKQHSEN